MPPTACLHALPTARPPPCRFTLLRPRLSTRLPPRPTPPHTHTHMHTCARLLAGRFVGGRYTPLPGGPGGAGDDAPSRPGTTVNSFCDAPHGLECGGLCWGSDVRVHSALHSALHKDALHNALHVHHAYYMSAASLPRALRRRLPASLAPYAMTPPRAKQRAAHALASLPLTRSRSFPRARPHPPLLPPHPPHTPALCTRRLADVPYVMHTHT